MASFISYSIRDASDEYSTVAFRVTDVTAGNFDSIFGEGVGQLGLDLQNAVLGVSSGNLARQIKTAEQSTVNDATPSEPYAQRELGLRVFYTDDVNGKKGNLTIPAPDLDAIVVTGDLADLTQAPVSTLVSVMEASVLSVDGNAITVDRATIVGRRS